jgi:hypothetical protein
MSNPWDQVGPWIDQPDGSRARLAGTHPIAVVNSVGWRAHYPRGDGVGEERGAAGQDMADRFLRAMGVKIDGDPEAAADLPSAWDAVGELLHRRLQEPALAAWAKDSGDRPVSEVLAFAEGQLRSMPPEDALHRLMDGLLDGVVLALEDPAAAYGELQQRADAVARARTGERTEAT